MAGAAGGMATPILLSQPLYSKYVTGLGNAFLYPLWYLTPEYFLKAYHGRLRLDKMMNNVPFSKEVQEMRNEHLGFKRTRGDYEKTLREVEKKSALGRFKSIEDKYKEFNTFRHIPITSIATLNERYDCGEIEDEVLLHFLTMYTSDPLYKLFTPVQPEELEIPKPNPIYKSNIVLAGKQGGVYR